MPTTAPTLDPRRILWDAYQAALADVATHEEVVALLRADLEHGEEALAAAHQLAYQILELLPATATGPPPAAPRHRKVKNTTRPPAPKPAPAPPSAGRPGPKTGKPPLDEIAEVVNAAIRANQPVVNKHHAANFAFGQSGVGNMPPLPVEQGKTLQRRFRRYRPQGIAGFAVSVDPEFAGAGNLIRQRDQIIFCGLHTCSKTDEYRPQPDGRAASLHHMYPFRGMVLCL